MAKKQKEKRSQLQMTDSKWEQAFMIAHLPGFVQARQDSYDKGKEYARIGNWVGVRGDMQTINSLMVDNMQVEGFGVMNSAQASALVPRISLSKVPTAFARSLYEKDPRSKGKPLPLQIPLAFADHATTTKGAAAFLPNMEIRGAGVQSIDIEQKFSSPGVNMSTIDVSFSFDSMRTFVGNQRKGVGFLDLIPTDSAMIETNGIAEVLWYIQLSVGWNVPVGYEGLFTGPQGQKALEAVKEATHTWSLGYGGEHDINLKQDGAVELKIKYIPAAQARDLSGMNSGNRTDILGRTKSSTSGGYRQKLQELRDKLDDQKKKVAQLNNDFRQLKSKRQQELEKVKDQETKAQKAIMEKFYNANPPTFALMQNEGWKPPKHLNPDKPDDLKKIQKAYAEWKASNQMATIGTDLDFGYGDGPSLKEHYKALKKKLKTATESYKSKLNSAYAGKAAAHKELQSIRAEIQSLKDHPASKGDMEDKYASFIRELFFRGHLHYITLTAKEQKDAAHGARRVDTAHHWFRGTGSTPKKGWVGKIKEKASNTGGNVAFTEQNLSQATEAEFNAAVTAALKNPPDTSKLLTAAISEANKSIQPHEDKRLNDKRIYYFYFGDLMNVVMDNYYHNMKSEEASGKKHRDAFKYDSLVLSDFYYQTYPKDGKPRKKKPEETIVSKAYNLGDFPISLSAFTKFFAERFVSAAYTAVSLEVFLQEMVVYLFGSESFTATQAQCWGPFLNPYLPAQRFDLLYDNLSTPVKLYRGVGQHFRIGGFYDTTADQFRNQQWQVPPDRPNATGNNDGQLYNYFCLGADPVEASPSRPAYTIFLGTNTSFVKDVRYTQSKSNEHLKTEAILKGAASGNGLMRLGNMMMYDVELTCMGAAWFKPGQCFELNNNIFGLSSHESDALSAYGEGLDDLLPRILIVLEVRHKLANGAFETKVRCMASGTSYKDFVDGRTEGLISNLPRPGTGKPRKGASGRGAGRIGGRKRPHAPPGASLK